MKKISIMAAVAALSIGASCLASPQGFNDQAYQSGAPRGFENNAPNTVSGVMKSAYDDQIVVLQGRLIRFLGKDKYEFADNSGDVIVVELDDDKNWSHISKDQLIEIVAEVDKDFMRTTLDVKRARTLN